VVVVATEVEVEVGVGVGVGVGKQVIDYYRGQKLSRLIEGRYELVIYSQPIDLIIYFL
jgi:hypothetical protein